MPFVSLTPLSSASGARAPLQARFERTLVGRGVISVFVVVTLLALVAINLPDGSLKRSMLVPAAPYLTAVGLDQNWGVFAPDGRRSILHLVATVRYRDGSVARWVVPEGGPVLGTYWDYRWRKWTENLMTAEGDGGAIRRPAALWIARQMERPGKRPATVTLATRFYDLEPPGAKGRGPWRETTFYRLALP